MFGVGHSLHQCADRRATVWKSLDHQFESTRQDFIARKSPRHFLLNLFETGEGVKTGKRSVPALPPRTPRKPAKFPWKDKPEQASDKFPGRKPERGSDTGRPFAARRRRKARTEATEVTEALSD